MAEHELEGRGLEGYTVPVAYRLTSPGLVEYFRGGGNVVVGRGLCEVGCQDSAVVRTADYYADVFLLAQW